MKTENISLEQCTCCSGMRNAFEYTNIHFLAATSFIYGFYMIERLNLELKVSC